MKQTARNMITSPRQLEVALALYGKGPLSARGLRATGTLLAYLERRGLIVPVPNGNYLPTTWALTPNGRKETRRCRKLHPDWLKPRT
jgi:hypothetical protein